MYRYRSIAKEFLGEEFEQEMNDDIFRDMTFELWQLEMRHDGDSDSDESVESNASTC